MAKAKAFATRKPRTKPYSTNPATARIREIEQSRDGLDVEIARINAKYRTRYSRAKAKLNKSSMWQYLSKIDQIAKEKDLKAGLDNEEDQELKKAADTWIELTNMDVAELKKAAEAMDVAVDSEGEQGSRSGDDAESESSWGGISGDDDGMDESDSQFEDDCDDPSENEDLFDENGNKMRAEDLAEGIRHIVTRHVRRLMATLKKYEVIDGEGTSDGEHDESIE
jgi:hypothetical protein